MKAFLAGIATKLFKDLMAALTDILIGWYKGNKAKKDVENAFKKQDPSAKAGAINDAFK
jgi:hypothetical protein